MICYSVYYKDQELAENGEIFCDTYPIFQQILSWVAPWLYHVTS